MRILSAPRLAFLFLLFAIPFCSDAQLRKRREYTRTFQVSLFPGISTNGIQSGFYLNKYSLNIFGGLSSANTTLELGLITNANINSTTGIQVAGLANIVGTNAFLNLSTTEEWQEINAGYESNFKGIQVAGFLNYVHTHTTGIQLAGVMNVVGEDFNGVQVAGLGNSGAGYVIGAQVATVYNVAHKFMVGVQASPFFNYTDGQLSGTQWGMVNKAKETKGRNSTPRTRARSLQFGFVNFSKAAHGVQIGLINFGGEMRGKQFGLVNFHNRYKSKENVDAGVPVGLLNFGSTGSVFRLYTNEMFLANLEYTMGNCQNCSWNVAGPVGMPFQGRNKKFNQNALILGHDAVRNTWGFGWGFMKILRNKHSMLPIDKLNERRMISYGLRFLHMNRARMIDRSFNLVSRVHVDYGRRKRFGYVFAGLSVNYFLQEEEGEPYAFRSSTVSTGKWAGLNSTVWPGYAVGVQF